MGVISTEEYDLGRGMPVIVCDKCGKDISQEIVESTNDQTLKGQLMARPDWYCGECEEMLRKKRRKEILDNCENTCVDVNYKSKYALKNSIFCRFFDYDERFCFLDPSRGISGKEYLEKLGNRLTLE
jgi:hypothetical protein